MKHHFRWLFAYTLSVPALAVWLQFALRTEAGSAQRDGPAATQAAQPADPVPVASPPLGEYPAPQVDASAPAEAPIPTF